MYLTIIVLICAKQPASYHCNVWHGFYKVYVRATSTESYQDLGDKNRGFQEG